MSTETYTMRSQLEHDTSTDACLFVLGCDRSGTTLLQSFLNAHSKILITYELNLSRLETIFSTAGREALLDTLRKRGFFQDEQTSLYWDLLNDTSSLSFPQIMAKAYRSRLTSLGKDIWGDKRPKYTNLINNLNAWFPNSRFVNIVRDPRAVALSFEKTAWGPMTTYYAAKSWAERVSKVRNDLTQLGPERSITIRYEDLLADPQTVLTSICHFIGVDFERSMLDRESTKQLKLGAEQLERLHPHRNEPVRQEFAERWKTAPRRVISHIEAVAWYEMKSYGFEPLSSNPARVPLLWKIYYRLLGLFRRAHRTKLKQRRT